MCLGFRFELFAALLVRSTTSLRCYHCCNLQLLNPGLIRPICALAFGVCLQSHVLNGVLCRFVVWIAFDVWLWCRLRGSV